MRAAERIKSLSGFVSNFSVIFRDAGEEHLSFSLVHDDCRSMKWVYCCMARGSMIMYFILYKGSVNFIALAVGELTLGVCFTTISRAGESGKTRGTVRKCF